MYLYSPGLWNADIGLAKTFGAGGKRSVNFELLLINAFNHRNTTVGGAGAFAFQVGGATHSITSTTFGQSNGTAVGPLNVQLRLQCNW